MLLVPCSILGVGLSAAWSPLPDGPRGKAWALREPLGGRGRYVEGTSDGGETLGTVRLSVYLPFRAAWSTVPKGSHGTALPSMV